jgi:hypothetical protein
MRTALKYAIFLALAVASGVYIVHGPVSLEDIAPIPLKGEAPVAHVEPAPSASVDEELDYLVAERLGSLAGWRAFLAAHASGAYAQSARAEVERRLPTENAAAEAAVAPVAAPASASIDEERDYEVAQRLGSLEGWRGFLATHGSGAYAQSARAEVERLLLAEKAPGPAAAEVSNGASTDASAASEAMGPVPPPRETEVASGYAIPAPAAAEVSNDASPDAKAVNEAVRPAPPIPPVRGTEVAALNPDEVCKRDEDHLARLRSSPSSDEAARFANELGCEKLRPQVQGLMESLANAVPAPAGADVSNGASPGAQAVREAARPASPIAGADVAALTPDETCKRDGDRLARLRGSPSDEEAQRFASELSCEKLRPQLQRLMESLGFARGPAPANSPPADSLLTGACASQRAALDRLRSEPSAEAARLFWRDLQCERLRPQVRLLMESLNLTPESLGSAAAPGAAERHEGPTPDAPTPNGADPVACRRETAELNRIRATPDLGDAKRFASIVTCDALRPQAARLLESLAE